MKIAAACSDQTDATHRVQTTLGYHTEMLFHIFTCAKVPKNLRILKPGEGKVAEIRLLTDFNYINSQGKHTCGSLAASCRIEILV